MAELEDKYADNIAGRYFVDEQCIDCDLCRETAPQNFTRQTDKEKNNQSKLDRKMGYISNVNDAKEILEKIFKSS